MFSKLAKYTGGGNTMKHEVGRDVISAGIFILGAEAKKLGSTIDDIAQTSLKAADLDDAVVSKLDNLADETGDAAEDLSEIVDGSLGKTITKDLGTNKYDEIDLEKSIDDLKDISTDGTKVSESAYLAKRQRGKDFNAKGEAEYIYNEITLEHPTKKYTKGKNKGNAKRYRVDTYDYDKVTNKGKGIISRKATDLNQIKLSTFDNYLKELINKYPPGSKIVAQNADLNGRILEGDFFLQLPSSNKNLPNIKFFEDRASKFIFKNKEYNIKIVYLNE